MALRRREVVLAFLQEHPGATTQEIARHLGIDSQTALTLLHAAFNLSEIGRQPPFDGMLAGNQAFPWYPATYSVAPPALGVSRQASKASNGPGVGAG